jgi:hypothetical protein
MRNNRGASNRRQRIERQSSSRRTTMEERTDVENRNTLLEMLAYAEDLDEAHVATLISANSFLNAVDFYNIAEEPDSDAEVNERDRPDFHDYLVMERIRRNLEELGPNLRDDEIWHSFSHNQSSFFSANAQTSSSSVVDLTVGDNTRILDDANFSLEEVPVEYLCPISFQVMNDPVYLLNDATGQRFDRNGISAWLQNKGTHPITRKLCAVTDLQEDAKLKSAIDEFVKNITANTPSAKK